MQFFRRYSYGIFMILYQTGIPRGRGGGAHLDPMISLMAVHKRSSFVT